MSLRRKHILTHGTGAPSFSRLYREKGGMRASNILFVLSVLTALPLWSQYPGQVTKSSKDAPELRSIAVLEWTGEAGKPKTSRLVPVAVLDQRQVEGNQLQDGGIYMARPEPLALAGEVEYELQEDGKPIGLFDIKNSGQEQGSWVGYGAWKALPVPKPKPKMDELARSLDAQDSDRPTLHRKHHGDDGGTQSGGGSSGSTEPAPSADPDRPTLHKKDNGSGNTSTSGSPPADDPDRPVLKKNRKKPPEDIGHVDSLPDVTDPDRPRLKRGQSTGNGLEVLPSLMGIPAEMQQMVAVSDVKNHPEHQWAHMWSNPDDEAKMKSALEEIARGALGLNPPAPAPKRTTAQHSTHKPAKPLPPPEPLPLVDERFRIFELAYNSGATLVLAARTDGPLSQQKFVTLIAQPDLYGDVRVVLKNVTDGAHLDETPRMRLVDAVDAMADNRGELLFELRGATQRQFALYRILRGQAEKLFVTSAGAFGAVSKE
jgi:hypothetical protein